MKQLFKGFILLLAGVLAVSMLAGCGGDDGFTIYDPVPAKLVSVTPAEPGGEIAKGRELVNETTYVIKGKVSDAAGNSVGVSVTFVTKGKA